MTTVIPSVHRVRASLLAGAMGDSLGADIEFLSLAEIRRRFSDGIVDLPPHRGLRGAVTDDTQMTLFTAEGLIRAMVRQQEKGICRPSSVVHHALLRWYRTQGGRPPMEMDDTGLFADRRLHAVRAPGNTCLSALCDALSFGHLPDNISKGCGTIMRVAPVAFAVERDAVFQLAMETSALTHGHPTGQIAAAAWALLLADVAAGEALEDAARRVGGRCRSMKHGAETADAIQSALEAPRDGHPETVESLGGGWVAEEALSIALYCCLAAPNLEAGLIMAVTHGGDSDSTGAVAGNMLGLLHQREAMGHRWGHQVECADLIGGIAHDLVAVRKGEFDKLKRDYPGW